MSSDFPDSCCGNLPTPKSGSQTPTGQPSDASTSSAPFATTRSAAEDSVNNLFSKERHV
ncbi:Hypothetical protein [Corynebacterium glutamicum ATCC 13032]|uniref:Uncharacterized protein n=1 Tax=Corynebacterium glutamicum (strain ATCC 13032 / DSM 20300 / JCM 1318 / BCRC 11384 / CCUG 27702 / LMG 3730 / NBRC 12168 / NCIMB 10025 / NRRL B-2784 / 534) TaxID=196627 RepID=Q8NRQ5_CORGL|nr:Hypothetical protein [Corynebacterium glutamicum ATCC 13032]